MFGGIDGSDFQGDAGPGVGAYAPGNNLPAWMIQQGAPSAQAQQQAALASVMAALQSGDVSPNTVAAMAPLFLQGNTQTALSQQGKQIANQNAQAMDLINNLTGQNGVLGGLVSSIGKMFGNGGISGLLGGLTGGASGLAGGMPSLDGASQAFAGFGGQPMLTGFQGPNQGASMFGQVRGGQPQSPTNFTASLGSPSSGLPKGQRGLFNLGAGGSSGSSYS